MQVFKYLYSFSYYNTESALCKLESKYIFGKEEKDRLLFSDVKAEPSSSAFIKNRLNIISFSDNYETLLNQIKKEHLSIDDFKVEYLVHEGDKTEYEERLSKLKDVGFSIEGDPDYYNPTTTYALCCYAQVWYFGELIKNNFAYKKHKQKPRSYSNSIGIPIAKALVNIASQANKTKRLLDACCGVGTIMLEACFSGNNIEGCDNNEKIYNDALQNLSYFNYTAKVYHSDLKELKKRYDSAIIDLPYNLMSIATESDTLHIIESAAEIADRLVIVSTSDISKMITHTGFRISDYCSVSKNGKRNFTREIWVCEKEAL